jgi:hypothetical protein
MKKAKEIFMNICSTIAKIGKKLVLLVFELILRIAYAFRDLGIGVWNLSKGIVNSAKKFHKRFVDSDTGTKLSHFVMGAGNFAHKQFVKGALFLLIQVFFILFMVASPKVNGTPLGGKAIPNFFTLGDEHGMPVSTEIEEIESNLVEVYTTENGSGTALNPSGFVISYKEDSATVNQLVRFPNLFKAVSSYDPNGSDTTFSISKNSGEYKPYETKFYESIIYDNRYGTGDIYGYSQYLPNEEFQVNGNATTIVVISSPTKLNTDNDINGENDFIDCFTADKPITLGVFYDKTEYDDNQESYTYGTP